MHKIREKNENANYRLPKTQKLNSLCMKRVSKSIISQPPRLPATLHYRMNYELELDYQYFYETVTLNILKYRFPIYLQKYRL